ncbi:glycosyltransferase [Gulosibacter sediminis]|uniref:glycosyltransferase family protein n=1 Tax=Gulosibacter sediminis TaxID=1729695 RepID=UPI001867BCD3|nr:glycosyltransferase [Gulosibacter sediminis]
MSRTPSNWRTALWHLRHGGPSQLREWQRRQRLGVNDAPRKGSADSFDPLDVESYEPIERLKAFGDLRVAVIMDDFSLQAWGYEFTTVELKPATWREQMLDVDLLFVESAWNGNHGAWQYQLTGSRAPSQALRDVVEYCHEKGIPTAFWNKEDPPHFDDFLDTAKLFDAVFTSDANKLPDYRERLGHDRVDVLNFAAQPAIHNPIRTRGGEPEGDIAFAGMYFAHKYPERREQMNLLLGAANDVSAKMTRGLTIYSRFAGGDENYQFPAPFDERVVGSLPYDKMLSAYREHKVFLNVNSVVDSPSMCARRVFEITASGTPVVSAPSAAIPNYFTQDEVLVVDTPEHARWGMRALVNSAQLRDRMVHRAQRKIWGEHTYTHRAEQVLRVAGIEHESKTQRRSVTAMVSTNRPGQVRHALEQVARQQGVDVQLALVTHGFDLDVADYRAQARELGLENVEVHRGEEAWQLGDCLNQLVRMSDGEFVAKMDDDDLYGPQYLLDQTNALWFSGADVVGKQANYLYLGARDAILLRNPEREHRWTTFVAGPTLVGSRGVFEANPFESRSRGEDTAFLRSVGDVGGRVYSADRFNFMQMRGATSHTWQVEDLEFLANARVESYGLNEQHTLVGE